VLARPSDDQTVGHGGRIPGGGTSPIGLDGVSRHRADSFVARPRDLHYSRYPGHYVRHLATHPSTLANICSLTAGATTLRPMTPQSAARQRVRYAATNAW
jgi:hypothetical protein